VGETSLRMMDKNKSSSTNPNNKTTDLKLHSTQTKITTKVAKETKDFRAGIAKLK